MTRRPKRSDVPRLAVLATVDRQSAALRASATACVVPAAVILADLYRVPLKVAYSAMIRDHEAGLLTYGVSITYPWLTDKGRAVLDAGPECCGGGPQWGHKWDCPKCPD